MCISEFYHVWEGRRVNGTLRSEERLGGLFFVGIAPTPGLSTLSVCIQLRLWVGSDNVIMTVTVTVSLGDACPLDVSIATCTATCSDPYLKWRS